MALSQLARVSQNEDASYSLDAWFCLVGGGTECLAIGNASIWNMNFIQQDGVPHATPSLETEDDGGEITDRESDRATFSELRFCRCSHSRGLDVGEIDGWN